MKITTIDKAKDSGLYNISTESGIEWTIPKSENTFYGIEEGFAERPTFLRCLLCDKVSQYSQNVFAKFSSEHGEMCRS